MHKAKPLMSYANIWPVLQLLIYAMMISVARAPETNTQFFVPPNTVCNNLELKYMTNLNSHQSEITQAIFIAPFM